MSCRLFSLSSYSFPRTRAPLLQQALAVTIPWLPLVFSIDEPREQDRKRERETARAGEGCKRRAERVVALRGGIETWPVCERTGDVYMESSLLRTRTEIASLDGWLAGAPVFSLITIFKLL